MTAPQADTGARHAIPMYGSPCAGCGRPAHVVLVMPHGRIVMHSPQDSTPCRVTGLAGGVS